MVLPLLRLKVVPTLALVENAPPVRGFLLYTVSEFTVMLLALSPSLEAILLRA